MKFRIIGIVLSVIMLLACGFTVMGEQGGAAESEPAFVESETDMVLVTRLLNMLNHNRVYNGDFTDITAVSENSIVALCDKADEDGYLKRDLVSGFVYNMYGMSIAEYKSDERFPEKEGCLFVTPTGYDAYSHEITSYEINGNYINVISTMELCTHDGYTYEYTCRSVFKANAKSAFGYNLISSVYY